MLASRTFTTTHSSFFDTVCAKGFRQRNDEPSMARLAGRTARWPSCFSFSLEVSTLAANGWAGVPDARDTLYARQPAAAGFHALPESHRAPTEPSHGQRRSLGEAALGGKKHKSESGQQHSKHSVLEQRAEDDAAAFGRRLQTAGETAETDSVPRCPVPSSLHAAAARARQGSPRAAADMPV